MFEGISLCKIQYSHQLTADSVKGINIGDNLISTDATMSEGMIYLKDCSFLLDGTSQVCPQFPVSDFARENLFYLQSFSYWESGPSYYTHRKNLDSYLIIYTYSGHGKLKYLGKEFSLKEGDVFIIDCKKPHDYRADHENWCHCDLHINGKLLDHMYENFLPDHGYCFHLNSGPDYQARLEELLLAYVSVNPYREYQISAQINLFVVYLLTQTQNYTRIQQTIPDQLKFLIHYVNNNYTQNLSLEFLSEFFGFSKYHLCRIFKKYTGYTINQYITSLRIEQAKELLRTTSLPASKICVMVGIDDTNYFYRLFKKQTGLSPNEYR